VEELRIYTTLTKEPEKYESTAPHVEAVKKARRRGKEIEPETTVSYVVTRGNSSISNRAELTEYADSYDADYYIENQVVPVAIRVLKVLGYTEDQLLGKGKQSGLDQFTANWLRRIINVLQIIFFIQSWSVVVPDPES